jgi:hypothetical protein
VTPVPEARAKVAQVSENRNGSGAKSDSKSRSKSDSNAVGFEDSLMREALDPSTPPQRLRQLARHRNAEVRRAVASNPNASRPVLASLALDHPEVVAANPVLEWWLLEDANWLTEIDERARHRLLNAQSLASGTRWWAARFGNTDDHASLFMCAHTTSEMLDYLRAENPTVTDLADDHVASTPTATYMTGHPIDDVIMEELIVDADDARDLLALATPAGWALELLDLSSTDLRRSVAGHSAAPPSLLLNLALDDDERTVRAAEKNAAFDAVLPGDEFADVKITARQLAERIKRNDSTLTNEQMLFVRASDVGLRCLVDHPNTSANVIAELVADGSWTTRQVVAKSTRLTIEQLETLATDDDRDVRAAVASNPLLPKAIVQALRADRDELVRTEATEAFERRVDEPIMAMGPAEVLDRLDRGRESIVAAYPDLLLSVQRRLAASPDWRIRHAIATNPTCAPSVLDLLAVDTDPDVRRQVARNLRTSQKTLSVLALDASAELRAIVANRNPRPEMLTALATDTDSDVRRSVAANERAATDVVRMLANDQSAEVRVAVAQRRTLPSDVALRLATDLADDVRIALVNRADASDEVVALAFSSTVMPPGDLDTQVGGDVQVDVDTQVGGDGQIDADEAGKADQPSNDNPLNAEPGDRLTAAAAADVFRSIQSGASVPTELVELFLNTVAWAGFVLVACEALDVSIQVVLTGSTEWKVREALARRLDTTPEVLRMLTSDADYDTRAAVAGNPNTPDDAVVTLSTDTHILVRQTVANRVEVQPEILDALALDDDADVREIALQRRDYTPAIAPVIEALADGSDVASADLEPLLAFGFAKRLAAGHNSTSPDHLSLLASDSAWEIREMVAAHSNTLAADLGLLATDGDRDVRRNVAGNPNTPPDAIEMLRGDVDRNVVRAANANASRPDESLLLARTTALLRALRSNSVALRIVALSCVEVPEAELRRRRHLCSIDWRERFAVATHRRTDPASRQRLVNDGLHRVRNAARHMMSEMT